MGDPKSDDWLPEGWRVDVKVRKNGRKDKWYFPPSGMGGKFNSKVEVFRYLNTCHNESEDMGKGVDQQSLENSPTVTKRQKLAVDEMTSTITCNQSSELCETAKEEQVSTCTGQFTPDQCGEGTESGSMELAEGKASDQREVQNNSAQSGCVINPQVGILPDGPSSEFNKMNGDRIKRTGTGKSKKKKDLDVPRRASKRLAGLPLDPTPEPKTTSRARRDAVKQTNEKATCKVDFSPDHLDAEQDAKHTYDASESTKMVMESTKSKHSVENAASPNKHASKVEMENKGDEKLECTVTSPLETLCVTKEHVAKAEVDNEADKKPRLPLDFPLQELIQDPCIAFAVKTLTGIEVLPGPNNYEFGSLATSEKHLRNHDKGNRADNKQGRTAVLPLSNLAIPEEHTVEAQAGNKTDEKSGSSTDLSFANAWADPCIEFAIKTLTGAIPIDSDIVLQDCQTQQLSSSHLQESSSLSLPYVGEFCQTEFFGQQYGPPEKPALGHNKNAHLGCSVGSSQCQHSKDRSNKS